MFIAKIVDTAILVCRHVAYLQATVNRSKGNNTEISKSELAQRSAYCRVSGKLCSNEPAAFAEAFTEHNIVIFRNPTC